MALMKDGSIVLASKDYRLYIYRYVKVNLHYVKVSLHYSPPEITTQNQGIN